MQHMTVVFRLSKNNLGHWYSQLSRLGQLGMTVGARPEYWRHSFTLCLRGRTKLSLLVWNYDTFWFWHFQILTLSNPDTFKFWHLPILTLSNSGSFQFWQFTFFPKWSKIRFWHFPILTLSNPDTFQFWHFPILTVSIFFQSGQKLDSDTFKFWHFPILTLSNSDIFQYWHFPIMVLSNYSFHFFSKVIKN